eukprot:TRINITY_DN11465_c0_g6_i4.p1 TRINITY_DN11465_c0_g6~~TRINITY_DN11465_c0_g6_i4.p1  ORF type:complete len:1134 (-),score=238.06 TRINITY_DN11465_c0_g6_i4:551-3952(-)
MRRVKSEASFSQVASKVGRLQRSESEVVLPRVARGERPSRKVRLGPRGGLDGPHPNEEHLGAPKIKKVVSMPAVITNTSDDRLPCQEPDAAAGAGRFEDIDTVDDIEDATKPEGRSRKKSSSAKKKKSSAKRTKQMRYVYDHRGHRTGKSKSRQPRESEDSQACNVEDAKPAPPAPVPIASAPALAPSTPISSIPRPQQPAPVAKPQSVLLSLSEPGALPRRSRPRPPKLDRLLEYSPATPSAPSMIPPSSAGGASHNSNRSFVRPTPSFSSNPSSFARPLRRTSAVEELRELVTKLETSTPASMQLSESTPKMQKLAHMAIKMEVETLSNKIASEQSLATQLLPGTPGPAAFQDAPTSPVTVSPSAPQHRKPPTPMQSHRAPSAGRAPSAARTASLAEVGRSAAVGEESAPNSPVLPGKPRPLSKPPLALSRAHSAVGGSRVASRAGSRADSREFTRSGSRKGTLTSSIGTPRTETASHAPDSPAAQKRECMRAVFKRLKDSDGELHRDVLPRALELLGYVSPEREWVRVAYDSLTKYSTLDQDEFISFVYAYEGQQESSGAKLFAEYDADGSGLIDEEELSLLLRSMGITPLDYVVKGILQEVCTRSNDAEDTEISYGEFRKLLEIIRSREGFTLQEVEEFKAVFALFDRLKDGELQTSMLTSALCYLGYALPSSEISCIQKEVDVDGSGTISEQEFLVCLRKVREREIARIRRLVGEKEDRPLKELRLPARMLQESLQALGYLPVEDAVIDAAVDAGIKQSPKGGSFPGEVSFAELWRFLDIYRKREGFSRKEHEGIERIFNAFDTDQSGLLDETEVGRLFRSMGLALSYNVARKLLAQIDRDGTRTVDLAEFRKLVRQFHSHTASKMKASFAEIGEGEDRLTLAQCQEILKCAGLPEEVVTNTLAQHQVDGTISVDTFSSFYSIAFTMQQAAREVLVEHAGFTDAEVQDLRRKFNVYDKNDNGELEGAELRYLLQDIFAGLANDPERRPELVEYIARADRDGSGTLDFKDFLRLARECSDLRDRVEREKELEAIEQTGFNVDEVTDFRDLFLGDSERNEVSVSELKELLSRVIPLGAKNLAALDAIIDETMGARRGQEPLRFWEFLLLIKKLLDADFAGIASLRSTCLA